MARYKLTKDGFTINVIEWDSVAEYTPPDGAIIELDDGIYKYPTKDKNTEILAQIIALEASVTERRLQGAIAGDTDDVAWFNNLEAQKNSLRQKLSRSGSW